MDIRSKCRAEQDNESPMTMKGVKTVEIVIRLSG